MRAQAIWTLVFACVLAAHPSASIGREGSAREANRDLNFRAAAAKIVITPSASALRSGDRIRDALFARALIIGNGMACGVMVSVDAVMIGNDVIDAAKAHAPSGCKDSHFIIAATHTHSGSTHGIESGGEPSPERVKDAIVDAVTLAAARMQPAKIGFGTAPLYLNTNRDLFTDNRWMQGPNPDGSSDKTLAVLEVLDAQDRLIGSYMNYAIHPINFYLSGVVSADVPGEAAKYIESRYGPAAVALFVQGASGDQNPLFTRPLYRLIAIRTGAPDADDDRLTRPAPWQELSRERNANDRMTAALKQPVPAEHVRAYEAAIEDQSELVAAMGAMIGETAVGIMHYEVPVLMGRGEIRAATASFECPGRDRLDRDDPVREGNMPPYADGAPVTIEMGVLRLGDIYIVSINGEVYSAIGMRLKRDAPVSKLMMTTLANGVADSGYIYSNDAGAHLTFQVIGSRLKPGCAEDRIVATALELMAKVQSASVAE